MAKDLIIHNQDDFKLEFTCWKSFPQDGCNARIILKKEQIQYENVEFADRFYVECPCCGLIHQLPSNALPIEIQEEIVPPNYLLMFLFGTLTFLIVLQFLLE